MSRLTADLRGMVAAGRPGDTLPSARELVARYRVSPVTVTRALHTLVAEGLVQTRPGHGTFVAARPPAPRRTGAAGGPDLGWQTVALADRVVDDGGLTAMLEPPESGATDLAAGYLDAKLTPARALADALARAGRRPGAWERPPVAGLPALRRVLADQAGVDPADMLVVPGGQAGLSTAFRALVPPGAPVLVETPTYPGAIIAARVAGLRPVPVPTDTDGLRPELLAEAFALTGARMLYCQPAYANPTGAVLAPGRRAAVLDAVRGAGAFLLEDDWARHFGLPGPPPPPLVRDDPDGHVVHLASLTKPVSPSLRIAGLAARGPALTRLRALRAVDELFVAQPLQEAAVEFLTAPAWPRHLSTLRRALTVRRNTLAEALRAAGLDPGRLPGGGLNLWVRLPDGADAAAVARRSARDGVRVLAGDAFHAAEPDGPYLRLTYCAAGPDALAAGARVIADAVSGQT